MSRYVGGENLIAVYWHCSMPDICSHTHVSSARASFIMLHECLMNVRINNAWTVQDSVMSVLAFLYSAYNTPATEYRKLRSDQTKTTKTDGCVNCFYFVKNV